MPQSVNVKRMQGFKQWPTSGFILASIVWMLAVSGA
jgi:hypothetical protein